MNELSSALEPLSHWLAAQGGVLAGYRFPLLAGAIAMVVSYVLTPYVRTLAIKRGAIDDPKADDRRVHKEPTPRWGGLAIFAGIFISLAAILPFAYANRPWPIYLLGLLLCGGAIVVMGALDDLYQYKARIQALFLLAIGVAIQFFFSDSGRVQIAGMGLPFSGEGWTSFGWAAVPITAIYIFVVTKTMDTIDGIDGLAAGIATIAAATLSVMATSFVFAGQDSLKLSTTQFQELPRIALIAAAIAGASLGFLRHNYNPAKIFMGTGGAQLLGFMLACISIVGVMKTAAALALFVPILVFGVPMFDAAFVIVRRLLSRQPITQADRRHLHHTLLGKGLSQRQAVWVLYLVAMTLCGALLVAVRLYA